MLRFGVAGLLRADDSTRSGMIMRARVALSGYWALSQAWRGVRRVSGSQGCSAQTIPHRPA